MKQKKIKSVLFNYENEWVVTDKKYSKVFGTNKNLEELQKEMKQKKIKNAVVSFVPARDTSFSL